jgi:hypothetical protein
MKPGTTYFVKGYNYSQAKNSTGPIVYLRENTMIIPTSKLEVRGAIQQRAKDLVDPDSPRINISDVRSATNLFSIEGKVTGVCITTFN